MEKLSVLIVEDDRETQKSFFDLANKFDNQINLIGITSSSTKALETITKCYPDAIILDLELHDGEGNGMDVLNGLKYIGYKPFVVVTTNNSSQVTYNIIRSSGTDYIFFKQQKGYSEKEVFNFLTSIKDKIKYNLVLPTYEFESSETINLKNKEIVSKLHREFTNIGMSNKNSGYNYLIEAIRLKIFNPNYDRKEICNIIANENKKSHDSVVHSMQNTINKTWDSSDYEDLLERYGGYVSPDRGTPTLSEFINHYADEIRNILAF